MQSDLKAIESNVSRGRDALERHFMDPRTNLIYDFRDPNRDVNLPTAEEIAREIPNSAGWATGFEDTAIAGGAFLDGLVRGWKLSGDAALAGQARTIWQGLRTLGTASSGRGFVCRGVLPSNGKSHYPNSSGDQYTSFCAGIYRYFHSDLAAAEDRTLIARLAVDIRDHVMNAGMRILREDGKPSIFGDVGRKTTVDGHEVHFAGPGVLQYLALAADTTGDPARRREYERYRDQYDRKPLRYMVEEEWSPAQIGKKCIYIYMQAAYCFRMLYDSESNQEARAVYNKVLKQLATHCLYLIARFNPNPPGIGFGPPPSFDWRRHHQLFQEINPEIKPDGSTMSICGWQQMRPGLVTENSMIREPMEGLSAIMLSNERDLIARVAPQARRMLATLPVDSMKTSASLYLVETLFWRGRELDLW